MSAKRRNGRALAPFANEWQTTNVPDLRIVSQKLFDAAQSRKHERRKTHPDQQRRPRHMLSGLLRCGTCGAGMSTNGKDKSQRIREAGAPPFA
jgi:hypothetical protein